MRRKKGGEKREVGKGRREGGGGKGRREVGGGIAEEGMRRREKTRG